MSQHKIKRRHPANIVSPISNPSGTPLSVVPPNLINAAEVKPNGPITLKCAYCSVVMKSLMLNVNDGLNEVFNAMSLHLSITHKQRYAEMIQNLNKLFGLAPLLIMLANHTAMLDNVDEESMQANLPYAVFRGGMEQVEEIFGVDYEDDDGDNEDEDDDIEDDGDYEIGEDEEIEEDTLAKSDTKTSTVTSIDSATPNLTPNEVIA